MASIWVFFTRSDLSRICSLLRTTVRFYYLARTPKSIAMAPQYSTQLVVSHKATNGDWGPTDDEENRFPMVEFNSEEAGMLLFVPHRAGPNEFGGRGGVSGGAWLRPWTFI